METIDNLSLNLFWLPDSHLIYAMWCSLMDIFHQPPDDSNYLANKNRGDSQMLYQDMERARAAGFFACNLTSGQANTTSR